MPPVSTSLVHGSQISLGIVDQHFITSQWPPDLRNSGQNIMKVDVMLTRGWGGNTQSINE